MTVRDKDNVKLKYPERTCKECKRYPCRNGLDNLRADLSKYGCSLYSDGSSS